MRLLITLRSLKACAYDLKYHHKLRGFLYGLQKGSAAFNRHVLEGYKYFCFSNIFPVKDMRHGDQRTLIVSCPNADWIDWLRGRLERYRDSNKAIEIGEMQFSIEGFKTLTPRIGKSTRLITGTPVILRIPKEKYGGYGITSTRPFEYWKPQYDFSAFLKQLSGNLLKKYNLYFNEKLKELPVFEEFQFKKEVAVHRIENGVEIPTVGTLWEFGFSHMNNQQRKVLELGLESGFGELNASGFGFVNIAQKQLVKIPNS
jgi:CRISPR-associated endoribonuclease Cas6